MLDQTAEISACFLVAAGGAMLFLALYLTLYAVLYQYGNPTGGVAGALFFGFFGSWLLAYGFALIIKANKKSQSRDSP
jgi:hypothetical protein